MQSEAVQIFTLEWKADFKFEQEKALMEWFRDLLNPKPEEDGDVKPDAKKAPATNLEM